MAADDVDAIQCVSNLNLAVNKITQGRRVFEETANENWNDNGDDQVLLKFIFVKQYDYLKFFLIIIIVFFNLKINIFNWHVTKIKKISLPFEN